MPLSVHHVQVNGSLQFADIFSKHVLLVMIF